MNKKHTAVINLAKQRMSRLYDFKLNVCMLVHASCTCTSTVTAEDAVVEDAV